MCKGVLNLSPYKSKCLVIALLEYFNMCKWMLHSISTLYCIARKSWELCFEDIHSQNFILKMFNKISNEKFPHDKTCYTDDYLLEYIPASSCILINKQLGEMMELSKLTDK